MPELTERTLLCRTCRGGRLAPCYSVRDHDPSHSIHDPQGRGHHPFDGIPYVPCPAGCENGARTNDHGLVTFKCFACEDSPVPGWVREEA